jgi:hypothetical protein
MPNKLVLQEVAYQTIIHGVGGILNWGKNEIWPPLLLYVVTYSFPKTKKEKEEVNSLMFYHFGEERFKRHDPKEVVKYHFNKMGLPWEYTTDI